MILLISIMAAVSWGLVLKRLDTARNLKNNQVTIRGFFLYGVLSIPLVWILTSIVKPILYPLTGISNVIEQILLVGLVEEFSKFLVFYIVAGNSTSIKEPIDGVLNAASVGLAFAVVENVFYSAYGIDTLLLRSVLTTVGHMSLSAIWGAAAGVYLYSRKAPAGGYPFQLVIAAIGISALLHGIYNSCLDAGLVGFALITDGVTLWVSLRILSSFKKSSPFSQIPFSKYREAIPLLSAALVSNPGNFFLNKRIALHYIRAGCYQKAKTHLKKANLINSRELSVRFYLELLDYLLPSADGKEGTRQPLYNLALKIPVKSLLKMRLQCRDLFSASLRKNFIQLLFSDLIDHKKGRIPQRTPKLFIQPDKH